MITFREGVVMQPFEKHAADLEELEATREGLLTMAQRGREQSTLTSEAYRPAIDHWDGIGEPELVAAQYPLRRDGEGACRALAWAAVALSYWIREVRAFNTAIDRIVGDDLFYGAAPVDGAPPAEKAIAAARRNAERRWWEAYNAHILDAEDTVGAMLRDGPTREHLLEAGRLGLLPPPDLVPEWHSSSDGLTAEELEWINNSVVVIGEQVIVAPSPAELEAALEAADKAYRGWRPNWLAGPDSWLVDPDHYEASVVSHICGLNRDWCGWSEDYLGVPVFEEMGIPLGRVAGAVAKNSFKRLLKEAQLPHQGGFRYVPPPRIEGGRLPRARTADGRPGIMDRHGNIWVRGPSRTKGEPFEWDVQLKHPIKWRMPDGTTRTVNHMNVSLDGRITHVSF